MIAERFIAFARVLAESDYREALDVDSDRRADWTVDGARPWSDVYSALRDADDAQHFTRERIIGELCAAWCAETGRVPNDPPTSSRLARAMARAYFATLDALGRAEWDAS